MRLQQSYTISIHHALLWMTQSLWMTKFCCFPMSSRKVQSASCRVFGILLSHTLEEKVTSVSWDLMKTQVVSKVHFQSTKLVVQKGQRVCSCLPLRSRCVLWLVGRSVRATKLSDACQLYFRTSSKASFIDRCQLFYIHKNHRFEIFTYALFIRKNILVSTEYLWHDWEFWSSPNEISLREWDHEHLTNTYHEHLRKDVSILTTNKWSIHVPLENNISHTTGNCGSNKF